MAADVAKFSAAVDKVWQTFSAQEVALDRKEMRALGERGAQQYVEQKFQQQLQKARGAFLQEFRNHSVVVESEARKIREELTEKLEEKYGERIALLRKERAESVGLVQKHEVEIAHLKSLATAQETYLTAVRHRWGFEQKEKLKAEIQSLKFDLERETTEKSDLTDQLTCRDELVIQLKDEMESLQAELKTQASNFAEEKRAYDERLRSLRLEMRQQQDHFKEHLKTYEDKFSEHKAMSSAELQIQTILNSRRSDALASMDEERQRHLAARTKPSPRIGPDGQAFMTEADQAEAEAVARCDPYELTDLPRYRSDDMGMDTSWRDYRLGQDLSLLPSPPGKSKQPALPRFRVERARKAPLVLPGPHAPTATDNATQLSARSDKGVAQQSPQTRVAVTTLVGP